MLLNNYGMNVESKSAPLTQWLHYELAKNGEWSRDQISEDHN